MTVGVQIHFGDKQARDLFNDKLSIKLPRAVKEQGYLFCEDVVRELRLSLRANSTRFQGKIYNSIKAKKHGKFSEVLIAKRGLWLDRMPVHKVRLKRGRLIRKWAMQSRININVQKIAARQGSITVRPHPFFDTAYNRSIRRLKSILKRGVDKALRSGG